VRDLILFEHRRQRLGFFDADRADQHRLLLLLALQHMLDDRVVFLARRPVDLVIGIVADTGLVGRDLDDLELVDVAEFLRLGHRRAGHAGELRIEPEIILEGNRGERLVFVLNGHTLLGLERLVQSLRVAPPLHHAAGELVDDDDLVVLADVVSVAGEQLVRAQCLVDVMDEPDIVDVVERAGRHQARLAQHAFDLLDPRLGQGDGALLFVLLKIAVFEHRDQLVDAHVELGIVLGRP
jgi:hypothetical protein